MQRWATLVFGLLVGGAVGAVVLSTGRSVPRAPLPPTPSVAPSRSAPSAASAPPNSEPTPPEEVVEVPDAESVAELPEDAPQSVEVGVIQFAYQGAEGAPRDAPTKTLAKERAMAAIQQARVDFAAAVKLGDAGSRENIGRIPRGVLEPRVEFALFTLPPETVHNEPLDTPRGYWIVRRNR